MIKLTNVTKIYKTGVRALNNVNLTIEPGEFVYVIGTTGAGKSTFIKNFMDIAVVPNIKDENEVRRTMDELPQSSAGKTIMTTEPKFIPNKAVNIKLGEKANLKVRLIDCVGFMVNGATGHMEEDKERMVKTPWFDYDIPFSKAAEIGTEKSDFRAFNNRNCYNF